MKRHVKVRLASIIAVALAIAIVSPTVLAADIMPLTAYQSSDYTIPQKQTVWNGKTNNVLWTLTSGETIFSISITSTQEKTVSGALYKVVTLFPDSEIVSIASFTRKGSDAKNWESSSPFNAADTSSGYYAVVYTQDNPLGVMGRVSVQ